MRAHAIILSDDQYEIEQIVEIFGVKRDTVRDWIRRFEQGGVDALRDEDRPGGPRKLNEEEEEILQDLLRRYPSRPATVIARLRAGTGKSIGRDTLRRYVKRFHLSWKRFRRSLRIINGTKRRFDWLKMNLPSCSKNRNSTLCTSTRRDFRSRRRPLRMASSRQAEGRARDRGSRIECSSHRI
ncbi:helix-turn-helix domain-containing protein [Rhodopirellula bahusiensis]|uniref:helix-turn-helix domain-containing protein n=1 Tax=Rhodopirellula bahusiensis TaxID=2014065 RepID=UPI0032985DEA